MKKSGIGGIIVILIGLSFVGSRVVVDIQFDRNCEGYLKRAADANTIELAQTELGKAVKYLEDNNLTEGFSSVFYQTPDQDVGFWYTNLKTSLEELKLVDQDVSQLEKSNVLLKLRETLMDGAEITVPLGMEVFPHNVLWMFVVFFGVVFLVVGVVIMFVAFDPY